MATELPRGVHGDVRPELRERGVVEVRGKGAMRTWLLVGRAAAAA
jgi:hypothetical protein